MAKADISTAALRAKTIYDRLMGLARPVDLSNNEWAKKAGVNTSFFTNLRNGSQPSVDNLRKILKVVGLTLPEFFLHDAGGRVVARPSQEQLEAAIRAVLPGLPRNPDRRAEYLAEAVRAVLALPESQHPTVVEVNFRKVAEQRKAEKARGTKKPAGSSLPRSA